MRESFAGGSLVLNTDDALGAAVLTIARPERRNALTVEMWCALVSVAARLAADPALRVTIIVGEGGHFCAGADIGELEGAYANDEGAARHQSAVADGVAALAALDTPVIAAIDGVCFGGGVALALACDLRFSSSGARFAVTPAKLGLTYGEAATRRLVGAVGAAGAKRLLFGARAIDAVAALRLGLVQEVADGESALDLAMREATAIVAVSQHSVRAMKRMIDAIASGGDVQRAGTLATPDFEEGRRAFLEKRAPQFAD